MEEVVTHNHQSVNVSTAERWGSLLAGGALTFAGLKRRGPLGYVLAALGGDLIRRGATGHCYVYQALGMHTDEKKPGEHVSVPYELGVRVDKSITVNKPREEIYRFWRNLENLPRFMQHLESVKTFDEKRSHWCAKAPAGKTVEWDAEVINESENILIGWRSLEGSDVDHAGSVHFDDAPEGRGTEVKVSLQYNPPGGAIGAMIAKLFGEEPSQQIQEDLHRFKQLMETGEIITTEGQSSGRAAKREIKSVDGHKKSNDVAVMHGSELSFPASDPPSWTGNANRQHGSPLGRKGELA